MKNKGHPVLSDGIAEFVQERFNKLVILESWKAQFADVQNQSLATGSLVWIFERLRMEERLFQLNPRVGPSSLRYSYVDFLVLNLLRRPIKLRTHTQQRGLLC
jgi:ABC-type phosphate transport system auxiliary subunit